MSSDESIGLSLAELLFPYQSSTSFSETQKCSKMPSILPYRHLFSEREDN